MPRNIDQVSIFGEYKQAENRLTAAFLQVLKVGGEPLIREISDRIGFSIPSSDIDIFTQIKEEESVPDGQLECNFTFCLYIESKVGKLVNFEQLANHLKLVQTEHNRKLLYLTGDETKPPKLPSGCHWISWDDTIVAFREYLADTRIPNYELLSFLIDQYETLVTNVVHRRKKWTPQKDKVIIVAGSRAEGIALTYGYYICQNHRQFQNAEYITFFKDNRISRVFRIAEDPHDDVDLNEMPELKAYLEQERPDYDGSRQKVFKLSNMEPIGPILNDSIDKNGNPCPYTYGQPRYTSIDKLKTSRLTSQL
jgi:hypothetical protein